MTAADVSAPSRSTRVLIRRERRIPWRLLTTGVIAIYLAMASLMAFSGVGLQYDEALLQSGAIDLVDPPPHPQFHMPGGRVQLFGRDARIMALSYLGSPKDYFVAGPMAVFGYGPAAGRLVSILLAAVGIYGISRFVSRMVSPAAGFGVAALLGFNASLIAQTVFDNGGFAEWVFSLGLLGLSVSRYASNPRWVSAAAVGSAAGFGVWTRLSMAWMLGPLAVVALLVFRRALRARVKHVAWIICGVVVGASPLIFYNVRTGFRSFNTAGLGHQDPLQVLPARLRMAGTSLVADSEYRAVWGGTPIPSPIWVIGGAFVVLAVAYAVFATWRDGRAAARVASIAAVTLCGFAALTLGSDLVIAEHHTVAFVPLAAVTIVAVASLAVKRFARVGHLAGALLAAYIVGSLVFDAQAIAGTHRTQGVRYWSSSIGCVADYLRATDARGNVGILDWGFTTSIYVLNAGETSTSDLFWGAYAFPKRKVQWLPVVRRSRRLLTHTPGLLAQPAPTIGVGQALEGLGRDLVTVQFAGHDRVEAVLIELRASNGRWLDKPSADISTAVANVRKAGCNVRTTLSTPAAIGRIAVLDSS